MSRSFRFTASDDRILERCEVLVDCELIAPIYEGASMYELTTIGYLYMDGDLDADTLPRRSRC